MIQAVKMDYVIRSMISDVGTISDILKVIMMGFIDGPPIYRRKSSGHYNFAIDNMNNKTTYLFSI